MSKHFWITLALIGTVVALAIAAIGVMSTPWFRRALERRLIVALEDATGGRVEVQEFRFHPIVLQVIFQGVVIHGSEPPQAPPLFSAHTVVLRLSPANLLHREIRIMSLDGDGAELHLKTNPDGSTNLPGPATRHTAGQVMEQLMDLRIGRVTLAHSTFFWNDRPISLDLSAREVALLLHLRRGPRYEGSLATSAVTTYMPGQSTPPLSFSTRFVLSQNELAVTSFVWQSRGMTGQGSFTFHPVPEPEGYFSFQTSFDVAALIPLLHPPGLQSGNLRLEGQGIYRHGEISAQGRLQARQMLFRDSQFNSGPLEVSADYSLHRSRVAISNLKVLGWGGSALGDGQVSLAGPTPQFHVRARLRDMNLLALLHSFTSPPVLITQLHPASLIDGAVDLTWAGEFEKAKSEFDLHFSAPAAHPPSFLPVSGDLRGSLETNHGFSLRLEDSNFHTPNSSLRAKGTLVESAARNESPSHLQIQWETTQFEEWRSVFEAHVESTPHLPLSLKSPASLVGEVTGSIENPEIRGSLRVGAFEYHGWIWDNLEANIVARPDYFQVSSGRLSHGTNVFSLEASAQLEDWRITKTSAVRISARAQRTPLEGLKAALGIDYPVGGYVSGQVNLLGTASNLQGTGALRVENGNIAGETVDSFSTSIRVGESTWDLDTIQMLKGHGSITGKAQIGPLNHSITCQLHGMGFSLAEFKRLALSFPDSAPPLQLQGQASFDLQASGTPDNFHFHSTMLVEGISVDGTQVGDLHVQLDGEGQKLQIRGTVSGPGGMFSLAGDAKTAGDWPLQLQGQYVSFRLDPWAHLLLNSRLGGQVTASGSFKANGSLRDASKFQMQSQIETLEVSFPSLKWRNEHPVELLFASNRLSAQPFRMQGPSTNLIVDGSLRLAGPASLSLTVQGIADATVLSLFDSSLQASGHSRIKLSMSGSPARPQLNGAVEIQDVSLDYPGLPFRLSNLNGDIQLEGERATVKSLRGISGGGTLTLDGFVTLALPLRFELRAELDQVRVRYPFDFTSVLSGTLRLVGTPDRSQLQGDLALRQVLASENKNWLAQIMQSGSPYEASRPSGAVPLADTIRLNVRVTSATPVRLEVQDMRLTADVDVHLQGSLANPVEVGAVHFLSGQAIFRGNRFTLNRGDLNLTNPIRTQATLDLEAQTRVQQYDLTVDISGPVGRLKMAYRSDPPLPTEDVLSLLALGYAHQQQEMSTPGLVSSFTGGNPLQSVGESALLSQALSSQVTGRIQRLFGVSRIKIDPNVGLPGFSSGARVTVEQQVTRDLTLTYVTNTASSQYKIIQFEWAFGENLSLIGLRDQNGIFGVELRHRQRFK
ncbi:MAG: translocation/assembly module TamB domain-containing protein [Terriglobia bacterium]|jgi:translocation and assembly module TamB